MAHRQAVRLVVGNAFNASTKRTAFSAVGKPFEQSIRTHFSKAKSKSPYEYGAHRSDAEELIAQLPIVEVDGPVALCDGGKSIEQLYTSGQGAHVWSESVGGTTQLSTTPPRRHAFDPAAQMKRSS